MWIMLNDAFFSIVKKDCARDELLVRARRPGDIEKVFPEAKGRVERSTKSDYAYRAVIKTHVLKTAIDGEINRINYANFKDSVTDDPLHDAYMAVWMAMAKLQPTAPYSGFVRQGALDDYHAGAPGPYAKKFSHPGRAKGGLCGSSSRAGSGSRSASRTPRSTRTRPSRSSTRSRSPPMQSSARRSLGGRRAAGRAGCAGTPGDASPSCNTEGAIMAEDVQEPSYDPIDALKLVPQRGAGRAVSRNR